MFKSYIEKILKINYPFLTSLNTKYFKWLKSGEGIVFMLHRVSPRDPSKLHLNEHLKVNPAFLEQMIIKYKKKGVLFVALDDIYNHIQKIQRIEKPFVCITIDDGYIDNYEIAYPVFRKHNIPFAIYLTSGFPNHKTILWWYILEELILSNDKLVLSSGEVFDCRTKSEKNDTFMIVRGKIISMGNKDLEENLTKLLPDYVFDSFAKVKELAMSWEQVTLISKDPLCTIGGHSVSHPAFNTLTEEEIRNEVLDNVNEIERYTGKKVFHFAYPFGSKYEVGIKEYKTMEQFGFKTTTLSYGGCISKEPMNQMALPRLFLDE